MIYKLIFLIDKPASPGEAAYIVDAETVSAGGIGCHKIGGFSRDQVTEDEAKKIGYPRERLRVVELDQRPLVFLDGPNTGDRDGWVR